MPRLYPTTPMLRLLSSAAAASPPPPPRRLHAAGTPEPPLPRPRSASAPGRSALKTHTTCSTNCYCRPTRSPTAPSTASLPRSPVLRPPLLSEMDPPLLSPSSTASAEKKQDRGWRRPQSAPTASSWTAAAVHAART
ncbi:hypothetical protein VPH35_013138 [Triticum aestivum]